MFSVYLNYFSFIEYLVREYNRIYHYDYFRIEYLDINSLSGIVELYYKDYCNSILESSEEFKDLPKEVKRIILQKSYLNPEELIKKYINPIDRYNHWQNTHRNYYPLLALPRSFTEWTE